MPYPQSKSADPIYLKNFDPKTFYPALAHTEELEPRADDISINPSSSISQQSIRHPDPEIYPVYVLLPSRVSLTSTSMENKL